MMIGVVPLSGRARATAAESIPLEGRGGKARLLSVQFARKAPPGNRPLPGTAAPTVSQSGTVFCQFVIGLMICRVARRFDMVA